MNAYNPPRQPILFVPWPVLMLIGALCLAYAVFALAPINLQDLYLTRYAFIPAVLSNGPGLHLTPWQYARPFVSYVFLHGGIEHLAANCVWLLPFGAVVARRFGGVLFFIFFFLCGIAGAGLHLATNWNSPVAMIGASGAISGLMGAAFRMIGPVQAGTALSLRRRGPLQPIFSRQVLIWSAVWTGVNIVAGVTGMGVGPNVQLIAWQVHLGGYFAGLLLAGPFAALADLIQGAAIPD